MSDANALKTWPERIYLQQLDDQHEVSAFKSGVHIYLNTERIDTGDVEYVRADLAAVPVAGNEREAKEAAIALWNGSGEDLQKADDVLRSLSSYLGMGGCWDTENLNYDEMGKRIREGIDMFVRVESRRATLSQPSPAQTADLASDGDAERMLKEARARIAAALPEDEPDYVPDWVCKLLIELGMEHRK